MAAGDDLHTCYYTGAQKRPLKFEGSRGRAGPEALRRRSRSRTSARASVEAAAATAATTWLGPRAKRWAPSALR